MSTRHLVDPQLLPLLEMLPAFDFSDAALPAIREALAAMAPPLAAPPAGVVRREQRVPGLAGAPDVRVMVYAPEAAAGPRPAVLHIHGGGYVMGTPEGSDLLNTRWVQALGAVIVSVDYRLAPEHPFPAPLDDCLAALAWLHAQTAALGVDPARVAVSGESAGGGLAATLAQRAHDMGGLPLRLQMLAAPMLDDRTAADPEAAAGAAGEFVWTPPHNRYGWGAYLRACDRAAPPPYAAAARRGDLAGLPPAFISLGALDLFAAEDLAYAGRLFAAGVPTELHVYPGGIHAFDLVPGTRIGAAYARERLDALRRAFGIEG